MDNKVMEESKIYLIEIVFDNAIKGVTSSKMKGDAKKALKYWKSFLKYITELETNNISPNDEKKRMTKDNLEEEHGKLDGQQQQQHTDKSQKTDDDETNEGTKAGTPNRSYNLGRDNCNLKLENESMKRQRPETPNLMKKLRKENDKLKEDVETYKLSISELETRLSSILGSQLTAGNPNIADLSDPYRPTLLGEQFRSLYDNELTDLLAYMEKHDLKEPESIAIMCDIIQNIDEFCLKANNQQVRKLFEMVVDEVRNPEVKQQRNMTCVKYTAQNSVELNALQEKTVERFVLDLHKALSSVSCVSLNQIFDTYFMKEFRTKHGQLTDQCKELNEFVSKAIQLLWMMKGHLPPVVLKWCQPDEPFDKVYFSFYTSTGEKVSQCIWPAVLLHKDGPLIARGIAQGK
ncbi:uncharacterized protein LOC127878028 isoform X1 [Dreissena polymorpha]|uniref:uncharacterized protein LOC127878028 isoform X1 n=1 Tax=Dreissena polymorpha TaxID=45954 RepID=UPI002264A96F|nr:uncharacterized protein LOC127878028 isoform X1 [Dreissena polymorpha]XP_052280377.1 uncharacterized protein LOC127878028 isoform X1 [Dreissena polymorpha]